MSERVVWLGVERRGEGKKMRDYDSGHAVFGELKRSQKKKKKK